MMRFSLLALLPTPAVGLLVLQLFSVGCKGSSNADKDSPAMGASAVAAPGKAKPKEGQLSEEPQVLFDATTGKTNALTWSVAGKHISFRVESYSADKTGGVLSAEVYAESEGKSDWLQNCPEMDKERGDRIELMLRYDSDPRVVEMLHTLCIQGGEPGYTNATQRYLPHEEDSAKIREVRDDSLELGSREGYKGTGIIYKPLTIRADALYLKSLAAGQDHICGIRNDGNAVCWGDSLGGQLDAPAGEFAELDVNILRSCGIRPDKTISCWGEGTNLREPAVEPPEGTYVDIAVGHSQMCAIGTDGKTQCWWTAKPKTAKTDTTARQIIAMGLEKGDIEPPAGNFVDIEAAYSTTCGLLKEGAVKCWGHSIDGLISDVPEGKFKQISLDDSTACALSVDNTISCWGSMIKNGHATPKGSFTQVSAGDGFACGVASDKSLQCWGGESGPAQQAPTTGEFTHVSAGDGFACAIKTDASVVCWGNDRGTDHKVVRWRPLF